MEYVVGPGRGARIEDREPASVLCKRYEARSTRVVWGARCSCHVCRMERVDFGVMVTVLGL